MILMDEKLQNPARELPPAGNEKGYSGQWRKKKILDSVSLSIKPGEHVVIIGPNGSGKSSLIKTLTKEYHPLAGADGLVLKIMGKETWHVFELRKLLGIV